MRDMAGQGRQAVTGARSRNRVAVPTDPLPRGAYRSLFEHVHDGVLLIRKGLIVVCNSKALDAFGWSPGNLTGVSFVLLMPYLQPDGSNSRTVFSRKMRLALSGKAQFFEWKCRRSDGSAFDSEVSLHHVAMESEDFIQMIVHDISERSQAEQALRESENKFRDLSEKSVVGVYLIQDWAFKYVNPKFAEIFAYPVEELLTTVGPQDVVYPEDWPMVRENIRKRIAGETASIHSEFRLVRKDDQIRIVEVYGSRTMYLGRPALIGSLLDVTQRKRSEELLRQAERKYRSIFENAVEGIFQTTPWGQIVAANPTHAKMLGYETPEEMIASLTDVAHQFYVDPSRRTEFMRILETEDVALGFECEFYKKDGTRIWVSLNARHVRDENNNTILYEGTIEDITEKKKVENQLRLLNEFNVAIIDHAPVAIFTLDREGNFKSINPALASLSGLGPKAGEKLIGFNWLRNPYTIQCGLAAHIERGLRGEPFQLWDFPFTTYRGDRNIFMDFKGVPLNDKNGEISGLLCIIEETTDRVKTRAKLMQEAKMSAIGRLAAGIAHELNNPLGTLVAYSELTRNWLHAHRGRTVEPMDMAKLKGYLEIIEEEAFRCKGVTTDILSLFQKEGLDMVQIDPNDLLDSLLDLMNVDRTRVRIVRESFSSLPRVRGDVSALRQVMVNLITNAVDAVEGRVDATIWVRTRPVGEQVLIEIEDNGTGIPASILDKIFEPFFTTKESKSGIGLGLSLCYDLVSDMGGTIKASSEPGHRTIFTVALPAEGERKKRSVER